MHHVMLSLYGTQRRVVQIVHGNVQVEVRSVQQHACTSARAIYKIEEYVND